MGIHNPVGGGPKDPYDEYREQLKAIEREKQEKQKQQPKRELLPIMQILLWMRRIVNHFFNGSSDGELEIHLAKLKELLEILKVEDRSSDSEFSKQLSSTWIQLLEQLREHKNKQATNLIKQINAYPNGEIHSLGYYLSERAGQTWLPIPYTEMLKKIHEDYLNQPSEAPLTSWINQLSQLLNNSIAG